MKKVVAVLLLVMFIVSGCQGAPDAVEAPPTIEELIADALAHSARGEYQEAILIYEAIIEIEPDNYEANYGLGYVYRRIGRTVDAIKLLNKAATLAGDGDTRAMYELSCAYLDEGNYDEAEKLIRDNAEDVEMTPELATVLLLKRVVNNEYREAIELLEMDMFEKYLLDLDENAVIYFGEYDSEGRRHGRGVGIYHRGQYIYNGEYSEGLRCGEGTWLRGIRLDEEGAVIEREPSDQIKIGFFKGNWENDMPNGYGENHINYVEQGTYATRSGNYTNGLENGDMVVTFGEHSAPYESNMGSRVLSGETYEYTNELGEEVVTHYYAYCTTCDTGGGDWVIYDDQLDFQWGIRPWGQT